MYVCTPTHIYVYIDMYVHGMIIIQKNNIYIHICMIQQIYACIDHTCFYLEYSRVLYMLFYAELYKDY